MSPLTTYQLDGETCIAADTEDGRQLASEVLGTCYRSPDPDLAEPCGDTIDHADLTADQQHHLKKHGWCCE